MNKILTSFDNSSDFFKANPQLAIVAEFQVLKKNKQIDGSKAMWAIALIYDYDSKFANLQEQDRIYLICKDYLGNEEFFLANKKLIDPAVKKYMSLQHDAERRYLKVWCDKLDELTEYLQHTKIDEDNAQDLIKLLLEQEKLMAQKDKIDARLAKKDTSARGKADYKPGLLESDELDDL